MSKRIIVAIAVVGSPSQSQRHRQGQGCPGANSKIAYLLPDDQGSATSGWPIHGDESRSSLGDWATAQLPPARAPTYGIETRVQQFRTGGRTRGSRVAQAATAHAVAVPPGEAHWSPSSLERRLSASTDTDTGAIVASE